MSDLTNSIVISYLPDFTHPPPYACKFVRINSLLNVIKLKENACRTQTRITTSYKAYYRSEISQSFTVLTFYSVYTVLTTLGLMLTI